MAASARKAQKVWFRPGFSALDLVASPLFARMLAVSTAARDLSIDPGCLTRRQRSNAATITHRVRVRAASRADAL
jgi:hypothetical protein